MDGDILSPAAIGVHYFETSRTSIFPPEFSIFFYFRLRLWRFSSYARVFFREIRDDGQPSALNDAIVKFDVGGKREINFHGHRARVSSMSK